MFSKKTILAHNAIVIVTCALIVGSIPVVKAQLEPKEYVNTKNKKKTEQLIRHEILTNKRKIRKLEKKHNDENDPYKTSILSQNASSIYNFFGKSSDVQRTSSSDKSKSTLNQIFYVDDDNQSGPWDGSFEHPYLTIREAVEVASSNDTVYVFDGVYQETVNMVNKGINLIGEDPRHTLIDAGGKDKAISISTYNNTKYEGMVKGFQIQNTNNYGLRIYTNEVSPKLSYWEVSNNFIKHNAGIWGTGIFVKGRGIYTVKNNILYANKIGIYDFGAKAAYVTNNTFIHNDATGISALRNPGESASLFVRNNIVTGSSTGIWTDPDLKPNVYRLGYNDFWENNTNYSDGRAGFNDISKDPKFVNPQYMDFHLKPDSPCIDTGHPAQKYNDRDGSRNDMGAYGGPGADYPYVLVSDLEICGFNDAGNVNVGEEIDYNACITNNGPNTGLDVQAVITIPSHLKIKSAYTDNGNVEISHSQAVFDREFLAPNTQWTMSLTVENKNMPGTVKADVRASSANGDLNQDNNVKRTGTKIIPNKVIYVNGIRGNDNTGNGSIIRPYKTIQKGIDRSQNGDMVKVSEGNYEENVNLNKRIALMGGYSNPIYRYGPSGEYKTKVHGNGEDYSSKIKHPKPVITINSHYSRVQGLFIDNIENSTQEGTINGGISINGKHNVAIEKNIVNNIGKINGITSGSGVWMIRGRDIDVIGNTIADNDATGIYMNDSYNINVSDNIIAGNGAWGVYKAQNGDIRLEYSDLWENKAGNMKGITRGDRVIYVDPMFNGSPEQNYLPKSNSPVIEAARWSGYMGALKPEGMENQAEGSRTSNESNRGLIEIVEKKFVETREEVKETAKLRKNHKPADISSSK